MSALAPGFLVAAPPLVDPHFDRSVVLLAAHGDDGAFGWVINGKRLMSLPELLVQSELAEQEPAGLLGEVRVGGPVTPEQVWLLYPESERWEELDGQIDVVRGVVACASRRALELIAEGRAPRTVLAVAGYAGWGPGQLEREIQQGAWLPTDADASLVFTAEADQLWHRAYERVGVTPFSFVSRKIGSA